MVFIILLSFSLQRNDIEPLNYLSQVIRIILGTFRNILEKIDDHDLERETALQMVQCKTLKTLELMDSKKFDDAELNDDVEFLSEKLHSSVQDFSSFDEYVSEVCFK